MIKDAYREITRLIPEDSFLVEQRVKDDFDFPIHFHPEYELNFIYRGKGVRRIVGDHSDEIDDLELVMVGPNVVHGWELHNCTCKEIYEITIHIHNDLLDKKMLSRRIFKPISDMFSRAKHGILFSRETTNLMMPRIMLLSRITGLQYYLEFISILNDLAISDSQKSLSISSDEREDFHNSDKIKKVYDYIQENFSKTITLDQISELVNMSSVSFNRFIKQRTGKTFIHYLNDTRISFASRWLLETELSIGEISFKCGFNNIANFNRLFKQAKNTTPKEFKKQFIGVKRVL
ncbi:helix-turn-helix domain-containing protein [Flavobacterium franklandianum]|uniref:Helix-turn-helix domain-containing protein n=1 Tax=Flavobacterium franklandianum TaxID=2594430 RepID=A0A553CLC2_9FLAO|nr:AraC family transcriptional regulator [Flavobacterium franklandianum]TRX21247.1 helix-turn-helix domain-containing protein [Flavobacterium franklandianum]TRX30103.1 helix-turn-helix domain-containing protein [Flavobacterium franklandianum]